MSPRLLLLSGMSRPAGYFDGLQARLPNTEIVPWIDPTANETISHYSGRLAENLRTSPGDCDVLCGVSFGGIVAQELAPL